MGEIPPNDQMNKKSTSNRGSEHLIVQSYPRPCMFNSLNSDRAAQDRIACRKSLEPGGALRSANCFRPNLLATSLR